VNIYDLNWESPAHAVAKSPGIRQLSGFYSKHLCTICAASAVSRGHAMVPFPGMECYKRCLHYFKGALVTLVALCVRALVQVITEFLHISSTDYLILLILLSVW